MKILQIGIIVCVIALSIWTYFSKNEMRKPAMVFAQRDVNLEFRPLLDANSHTKKVGRPNRKSGLGDSTQYHAGSRRPKITRDEAFNLRREDLAARDGLSTVELALEMEIARLNGLRAQSSEANTLVRDIMNYFEKIKTDKSLSKRYRNVPTDENGLALNNQQFGEMMIRDKSVLRKWKRLMAISAENDEVIVTDLSSDSNY